MPLRLSGFIIALLATAAIPAWAQDAIGQIKTETGTVLIQHNGAPESAAIGVRLFESDSITTSQDGSIGITFADNSTMSLGPNTRLDLDTFQFDSTTHLGNFNVSLEKGTLAVKSGDIVRQTPEAMHIKTPVALLGVRGTEFVVLAADKSR